MASLRPSLSLRRRAALLGLPAALATYGRGGPAAARAKPWSAHDPSSPILVDNAIWRGLLDRHCRPGADGINRFAYAAVGSEEQAALDTYLGLLAGTAVSALSRPTQLAFWVNLHNALVVRLVLDHLPLDSIREIGVPPGGPPADGPWATRRIAVEGIGLSLGEIANDILRRVWKDPRINYVICCATLGAPNLPAMPLEPALLDRHLDSAASAFVNHPRGAELTDDGRLRVSSLYEWHRAAFGGSEHAVIKHLMAYAAPPLAMQLRGRHRIDGHAYDWRLNDAPIDG